MPQVLRPENIGTISRVSNSTLSIGPSIANIGGQQRTTTSTITVATNVNGANGLDTGTIAINQFYYIYLVNNSGTVAGVLSLSSSAPTGFPAYKLVGQCTTDGSSNLVAANLSMVDNAPVGHVIASMLTEAMFKAVHGNGWVLAAGQSVSGSKYHTITGGTTAPDLRGRTIAGVDNMGGSAANRLTPGGSGITATAIGNAGGAETHTLSIAQLPAHDHGGGSHTHQVPVYYDAAQQGSYPGGRSLTGGYGGNSGATNGPNSTVVASQGSGSTHQNTQPTIVMNYFIKIN